MSTKTKEKIDSLFDAQFIKAKNETKQYLDKNNWFKEENKKAFKLVLEPLEYLREKLKTFKEFKIEISDLMVIFEHKTNICKTILKVRMELDAAKYLDLDPSIKDPKLKYEIDISEFFSYKDRPTDRVIKFDTPDEIIKYVTEFCADLAGRTEGRVASDCERSILK